MEGGFIFLPICNLSLRQPSLKVGAFYLAEAIGLTTLGKKSVTIHATTEQASSDLRTLEDKSESLTFSSSSDSLSDSESKSGPAFLLVDAANTSAELAPKPVEAPQHKPQDPSISLEFASIIVPHRLVERGGDESSAPVRRVSSTTFLLTLPLSLV